jgi:hypothetical protein
MDDEIEGLAVVRENLLDRVVVSDIDIVVRVEARIPLKEATTIPFSGSIIPEEGLAHVVIQPHDMESLLAEKRDGFGADEPV